MLTPIQQLYGEITALQIVVQRLLGYMALASGSNVQAVMNAEHGQASAELAQMKIASNPPGDEDAIRAHAQTLLDDIYTVASTTKRGMP